MQVVLWSFIKKKLRQNVKLLNNRYIYIFTLCCGHDMDHVWKKQVLDTAAFSCWGDRLCLRDKPLLIYLKRSFPSCLTFRSWCHPGARLSNSNGRAGQTQNPWAKLYFFSGWNTAGSPKLSWIMLLWRVVFGIPSSTLYLCVAFLLG